MKSSPFRNYAELASSPARVAALNIAAAGLAALAPEKLLRRALNRFSLAQGRLFVIGGGKAADVMAEALEHLVGPESIAAGLVICKSRSASPKKIEVREAGHPVPDHRGLKAMSEILAIKSVHNIGKDDLVICLLSGGASALMPCPAPGINLEDKQTMTRMLLSSGAGIAEVNGIRKHLSASKGGKLGAHFAPAAVISLIVSDVIGNDLGSIASGPTVPNTDSVDGAIALIKRYGLWEKVPAAIRRHLEGNRGIAPLSELPNCRNLLIGDSRVALEAMSQQAKEMGKRACILPEPVQGDPESAAVKLGERISNGEFKGFDVLLAGGETTPTLPANPGQGGRNQHFALATMTALEKFSGSWAHLSLGSDGSDYLPDVAGALVDKQAMERIQTLKLSTREYLDRFDSYSLFKKIGGCSVETWPTGTNVGDLMVWVMG